MAIIFSLTRPYARRIYSIFRLCMDLNVLDNSTYNSVASRFFVQTPSMIVRIVRICNVLDRFLRKTFWFFQRIFSISRSIRLRSKVPKTLADIEIRVIPSIILGDSEVTFLRKGEDAAFSPSLSCILLLYNNYKIKEVSHRISFSFILLGVYLRGPQLFCFYCKY